MEETTPENIATNEEVIPDVKVELAPQEIKPEVKPKKVSKPKAEDKPDYSAELFAAANDLLDYWVSRHSGVGVNPRWQRLDAVITKIKQTNS